MKKILVLGGNGFIGGHVVDNLVKKGYRVTVFCRHRMAQPNPLGAKEKYDLFFGDIKDKEAVNHAVSKHDGAINLAGILGTSETVDNPYPSVEVNVVGGLNFLQAVREYKLPAVQIAVGNHFMNNSYAITKTTTERFALMFNKEFGTKIAVVRGLNAYGPRQKHAPVRKITPNFIIQALQGKPIKVYGNGEQIMDMVYVEDLADILVRALTEPHGVYDKTFAAGTGEKTTVNHIADTVARIVQKKFKTYKEGAQYVEHVPMRAGEPENAVVVGDPQTLRPLFAAQTVLEGKKGPPGVVLTSLEDGLSKTIDWYYTTYPWKDAT